MPCPNPSQDMRLGRNRFQWCCSCEFCAPLQEPERERLRNMRRAYIDSQMADVDDVAVTRAVKGTRPEYMTRGEKFVAFKILNRTKNAREIAEHLDVSERTIVRWRATL